MKELKLLTLSDLFDLLMEQTNLHAYLRALNASHNRMMVSGQILRSLQAEITLRKLVDNTRLIFLHKTGLQHPHESILGNY